MDKKNERDQLFVSMQRNNQAFNAALQRLRDSDPQQLAIAAAIPEHRQRMIDEKAKYAAYRQLIAATVRDLAEVDRILAKALRRGRWGIHA